MMIDLFATILEELILSFSISSFLKIKHAIRYILLSTCICIVETYLFSYFYINNFFLILLIVFTHTFLLMIIEKKELMAKIFSVIFFVLLLLISNYVALYIFSILHNIPIIDLSTNLTIFNYTVIFSKFIFAIISLIFCLYFNKRDYNFVLEKNGIISAIILDIVLIFTILGESLVYGKMLNSVILIVMFQLIILSVLICLLYNRIHLENKEKIILAKKATKLEYLRINNDRITQMYNVIISKEHNMIYLLRKIRLLVDDENTQILQLIDQEIEKIISYKFISNTGNSIFDIEISNKINMLKDEGYDIKVIIMIDKDSRINNSEIISKVLNFIEYVTVNSKNNKIDLRIKKVEDILVLKSLSLYKKDTTNLYEKKIINEGKVESIDELICLEND